MLRTFPHSVTSTDAFQIRLLHQIDGLFSRSAGVSYQGKRGPFGTVHIGFNRANGNNQNYPFLTAYHQQNQTLVDQFLNSQEFQLIRCIPKVQTGSAVLGGL
ncbi:uncharacterized protein EI90DRAFT_477502 [Cantharellus anzutake]|uniref:uncharacterized protein n=1 Tax=Cantharellus anzutake TaxID=1750568 RepID=UPI001903632D|nr:uncharacterized protein EI90DRAFT_477502 [Cantharellus anzutake]KAF8314152.1 hypothetical protein EI90DRAFT_477502 [Cantharellus anzutake]